MILDRQGRVALADPADAFRGGRHHRCRGALRIFIANGAYKEAGYTPGDVDSGAVILTGEAIKRKNARAIDEIFANEAGKFVCATAGHKLECILAAHGSGAVALSRERQSAILHVDVGGSTTKLAHDRQGRDRRRHGLRGRRPPRRAG